MKGSLARFGVFYIAGCEWTLSCVLILFALIISTGAIFSKTPNTVRSIVFAWIAVSTFIGIAIACFCAGRALVRGARWAWFCSWVIGVVTIVFGGYIIHVAMQPDPYGDSGEAGLLGIAILIFAMPALMLLALPSVRVMFRRDLPEPQYLL
jgi:hypothetical protein